MNNPENDKIVRVLLKGVDISKKEGSGLACELVRNVNDADPTNDDHWLPTSRRVKFFDGQIELANYGARIANGERVLVKVWPNQIREVTGVK